MDPTTDLGPLISKNAVAKAESHVLDAIERGATICTSQVPRQQQNEVGNFMSIAVLRDATDDMLIAAEETFGPVAAVFKVIKL